MELRNRNYFIFSSFRNASGIFLQYSVHHQCRGDAFLRALFPPCTAHRSCRMPFQVFYFRVLVLQTDVPFEPFRIQLMHVTIGRKLVFIIKAPATQHVFFVCVDPAFKTFDHFIKRIGSIYLRLCNGCKRCAKL